MDEYYFVTLNVELMKVRLSRLLGHPVSDRELEQTLLDQHFVKTAGGWIVKSISLGLLPPDEILLARSLGTDVEFSGVRIPAGTVPSPQSIPNDDSQSLMIDRLRALPESHLCLIPDFLIGDHRSVVVKSRPIIRSAVKHQSWQEALRHTIFIPIAQTGPLVVADIQNRVKDGVILFEFEGDLSEKWLAAFERNRDLAFHPILLSGLDYFWFFLCLCCSDFPSLVGNRLPPDVQQQIAESALRKMLRWWPYLCACESRYVNLWGCPSLPLYWKEAGQLAKHLGIADGCRELQRLSMADAGDRIRDWLGNPKRDRNPNGTALN